MYDYFKNLKSLLLVLKSKTKYLAHSLIYALGLIN
jgi:hypothetical protein